MARPRITARTAPTPRLTLWVPALLAGGGSLLFLALLLMLQR